MQTLVASAPEMNILAVGDDQGGTRGLAGMYRRLKEIEPEDVGATPLELLSSYWRQQNLPDTGRVFFIRGSDGRTTRFYQEDPTGTPTIITNNRLAEDFADWRENGYPLFAAEANPDGTRNVLPEAVNGLGYIETVTHEIIHSAHGDYLDTPYLRSLPRRGKFLVSRLDEGLTHMTTLQIVGDIAYETVKGGVHGEIVGQPNLLAITSEIGELHPYNEYTNDAIDTIRRINEQDTTAPTDSILAFSQWWGEQPTEKKRAHIETILEGFDDATRRAQELLDSLQKNEGDLVLPDGMPDWWYEHYETHDPLTDENPDDDEEPVDKGIGVIRFDSPKEHRKRLIRRLKRVRGRFYKQAAPISIRKHPGPDGASTHGTGSEQDAHSGDGERERNLPKLDFSIKRNERFTSLVPTE
ncbi:MAG: hypothetical protein R3324_15555, partial [Halobacteriales archaeon]|nr:hypothetical protein [Halobacteriales archaeon]